MWIVGNLGNKWGNMSRSSIVEIREILMVVDSVRYSFVGQFQISLACG